MERAGGVVAVVQRGVLRNVVAGIRIVASHAAMRAPLPPAIARRKESAAVDEDNTRKSNSMSSFSSLARSLVWRMKLETSLLQAEKAERGLPRQQREQSSKLSFAKAWPEFGYWLLTRARILLVLAKRTLWMLFQRLT